MAWLSDNLTKWADSVTNNLSATDPHTGTTYGATGKGGHGKPCPKLGEMHVRKHTIHTAYSKPQRGTKGSGMVTPSKGRSKTISHTINGRPVVVERTSAPRTKRDVGNIATYIPSKIDLGITAAPLTDIYRSGEDEGVVLVSESLASDFTPLACCTDYRVKENDEYVIKTVKPASLESILAKMRG